MIKAVMILEAIPFKSFVIREKKRATVSYQETHLPVGGLLVDSYEISLQKEISNPRRITGDCFISGARPANEDASWSGSARYKDDKLRSTCNKDCKTDGGGCKKLYICCK